MKEIPKYESYKITKLGKVYRCNRELKNAISNRGYSYVTLCKNGKRKMYYIHQLVAMTYLNHNPCGLKIIVDHIDGDKLNNNLSNLQLISNSENIKKSNWCKNPSLPKGITKTSSGNYKSYYWCKDKKKNITLGTRNTISEAKKLLTHYL